MYLYFDHIGRLRELINDEALRQGNYGVNKMYVFIDRNDVRNIDVSYLLPSGATIQATRFDTTVTEKIPFNAKRDLRFFKYFKDYTFFVIDMENDLYGNNPLDEAGVVHASLNATLESNTALELGDVNFNVEESFVLNQKQVASEEYMSLASYLFLKSLYDKLDTSNFVTKAEVLNAIVVDSSLPVASSALSTKFSQIDTGLANSIKEYNSLQWDTTPTSGSTKPVTSGGIFTALSEKVDHSEVTEDISENDEHIVTSNAVWNALLNTGYVRVINYFQTKADNGQLPASEYKEGVIVFDYEEGAFYFVDTITDAGNGNVIATYYSLFNFESFASYDDLLARLKQDDISWLRIESNFTSKANNGTLPYAKYRANVIVFDPNYKSLYQVSTVTELSGGNASATYNVLWSEANYVSTYDSNPLRWDTTPTLNSTKPVTSGGVKTAIDTRINASSPYYLRVIPNFETATKIPDMNIVRNCAVFDPLNGKFYLVTSVAYIGGKIVPIFQEIIIN